MADHLKVLANWMLENNIHYKDLKLISTGGGPFSSDLSEKFQNIFGHSGIDMYGFEEGGMIGSKCPHCNLNYFADDSFIIEVLDENDAPVEPGKKGRAVITNLDQFTTPIIRYDIGDFITLPSKEVNCKNKFTHWVSIDGREADTLTLKNGRIITYPNISNVKSIEGIKQYQFFQKSNGELIIKYVCECTVDKKEIEKSIIEKMGLEDCREVSFEECNSIPLEPTGKFKTLKKEA